MPAQDEANVRMTADDAQAMAAWNRQFQATNRLEQKIDRLGQAGAKSGRDMEGAFTRSLLKVLSVEKGVQLLIQSLERAQQATLKFREEAAGTTLDRDDAFTRFRVQAGLEDENQAAPYRELFKKIAVEFSTTFEKVASGATQLVSSGLAAEEVLKGAASGLVKSAAATNALDQDFASLAKSQALYLTATGQALTAANLEKLQVASQRLFKLTNLQAPHLEFLAAEAGAIGELGGPQLKPEDQLVIFSQLLQSLGERQASTAFRATIMRMSTAGGFQDRVGALEQIGLKPEDIDLVGETIDQAMARLSQALEKVPAAQQNIILAKLFGEEAMKAAVQLMKPELARARPKLLEETRNVAGFETDVRLATRSQSAAQRRAEEAVKQAQTIPQLAEQKSFRTQFEAALTQRVAAKEINAARMDHILNTFDRLLAIGGTPAQAAFQAERAGAFDVLRGGDVLEFLFGVDHSAAQAAIRAQRQPQIEQSRSVRELQLLRQMQAIELDRGVAIGPKGARQGIRLEALQQQLDAERARQTYERFLREVGQPPPELRERIIAGSKTAQAGRPNQALRVAGSFTEEEAQSIQGAVEAAEELQRLRQRIQAMRLTPVPGQPGNFVNPAGQPVNAGTLAPLGGQQQAGNEPLALKPPVVNVKVDMQPVVDGLAKVQQEVAGLRTQQAGPQKIVVEERGVQRPARKPVEALNR